MCLPHVSSIFKKISPKTFGPHCVYTYIHTYTHTRTHTHTEFFKCQKNNTTLSTSLLPLATNPRSERNAGKDQFRILYSPRAFYHKDGGKNN